MYLIIADIFYLHSFALRLVKSYQNAKMLEIRRFMKICLTSAKDNQIKIIPLQELYMSVKYIISLFIIGQ